MRPRVVGLVLSLLALTAACAEEAAEEAPAAPKEATISDVTVTGSPKEKPTVEFKAPISFAETAGEVIAAGNGEGDAVEPDSTVTVHYVGTNASDGAEFVSSWDKKPVTFGLSEVINGLAEGLRGAHAGDRVLLAIASVDGFDPNGNGTTVRKGDSLVFVVDVLDVMTPLDMATGKEMTAPDTVPTLTYDDEEQPKEFVATKTTPKSVDELGVYPILKGEGPKVKKTQTLTVEYLGQIYPDGKVFDESWSAEDSRTFQLDQVIAGWTQGLAGQTVGSRVILVIPSKLGYGAQAQGEDIPANSDLIFAIDILAAT
ncbi:MAG: FKBP-type peptidyl-prolyl cis-trans isomerase [Nocardioidaceae bacterium]|nr:FKBP-type peptidyl-prolyl cis-trans isomerase [Nocardioidaceae bacterium]